jgi:hypothetical protein
VEGLRQCAADARRTAGDEYRVSAEFHDACS